MRLKRQSSMPAKNAILPRFSSSTSTATAPAWAIASTISTPGITGRSGKWPGNHQSSARTSLVRDDLPAGLELDHLVEQQERVAVRQDRLDLVLAERDRGDHAAARLEQLAHRRAATVRVALRGADRHPGRCRDLLEREAERVLEHEHARLGGRQPGEAVAQVGPQLRELRLHVGAGRGARRESPRRGGSCRPAPRRCATSRQAFTVSRCSQVEKAASPRNWPSLTHSFASASCAASRASSGSRSTWAARRSTRGAWRAQSASSASVAVLGPSHEHGDRLSRSYEACGSGRDAAPIRRR